MKEVPARTLGGGGDDRYIATTIPRGEAVRRADAVGASAGVELAEPPSGLPCAGGDAFGVDYAFDFPLDGPARPADPADHVAAEAGGHRLLVRDANDERLCVGVDRLLADGSDCRLPPVTADEAFGFWRSGVVSAVLPAEVARVRLPGGGELPTTAGGYTGRYASGVRLLLVELEARSIHRIRMLDSAGGVIGNLPVFAASGLPPTAGPVRLAAGRGWRLTAGGYGHAGCVGLGLRGKQPDCDTPVRDDAAFAA